MNHPGQIMLNRYNNIRVGLVLGILAPLLGFLAAYLAGFRGMSFTGYVEVLVCETVFG